MTALQIWHEILQQRTPERLGEILAPDCVFYSPVVFRPQQGRELTRRYLTAATRVFNDSFQYLKEVVTERHAVLEFTCDVDGVLVNGVDILTFDEDGLICEFKVMVRPLKGIQLLHERMRAMLETMT